MRVKNSAIFFSPGRTHCGRYYTYGIEEKQGTAKLRLENEQTKDKYNLESKLTSDGRYLPHMITLQTSGRRPRGGTPREHIWDYIFKFSNLVAAAREARVAFFTLDP